ncbi:hypothetical protein LIX60_14895 [Streptomyces sp. S07_1.15]|uniref:hypothetical protein n=1 Tax=Streptomyces sp. S07_1.15 TaxID=2873925 RepID=UPI001D154B40|nr:hypothetical protein [Streptomyces sp. S07_1.15]MCC3652726.1 hypothetical protein [Streptomyces sp. S07_1.15]
MLGWLKGRGSGAGGPVPVVVRLNGFAEFDGLDIPLPGWTEAEFRRAWELGESGQVDAPEFQQLLDALRAAAVDAADAGPWGPGDEAELLLLLAGGGPHGE